MSSGGAVPSRDHVATRRRRGLELLRGGADSSRRMLVLGSFNLDLLPPFLAEATDRAGFPAQVELAPFGQADLLVADPSSALYRDAPDAVVLVQAPEDALQPLFDLPASQVGDPAALADASVDVLRTQLETILDRLPGTTCYVVAFGTDRAPNAQVLDPLAVERGQAAVERFTTGVRALARMSPRIVVVDWDWHVRRLGWSTVRDDRLWYLGRMRLSPTGCAALAELVADAVAAHAGGAKKVVALDLDNTLWGGIVGEDGLKGLEIGGDGVGAAFQDFQRELLKLHDAGVLLVVASKNDRDDAVEVLETHPEMILRLEHLAADRIDWRDKATSLREIAAELNLGLDSFVFLDDNPVERTWISESLPEVLVPELPPDPADRPAFLRAATWFARIETTAADRRRAATYAEQRHRTTLLSQTTSFEEFIASLEQNVTFESVRETSLARAAQMCQRTNQFNLTTRRYTAADLEQLGNDPNVELYTLAVSDRFGDSGITGLTILRHDPDRETTEIDTLLMSCRVLGRRVEDAFLAFIADRAAARGSRYVDGLFEPTRKNGQVAAFYAERGFADLGDGRFRIDLAAGPPASPEGVGVTVAADA